MSMYNYIQFFRCIHHKVILVGQDIVGHIAAVFSGTNSVTSKSRDDIERKYCFKKTGKAKATLQTNIKLFQKRFQLKNTNILPNK